MDKINTYTIIVRMKMEVEALDEPNAVEDALEFTKYMDDHTKITEVDVMSCDILSWHCDECDEVFEPCDNWVKVCEDCERDLNLGLERELQERLDGDYPQ